ncbi:MAG TPA: 2-amino-4-hydroxy-6-hydroxymethyldihydropteridine diphosphokinase [Candidatus Acidoferrales bacterium]|jgi:2-amino-4-hydroxy-6-hydroxymethyldihydropteridine diphosphokinase|nr:2-amino-4-hydroxy-6-hydroxymethyldihydropteridine diphosphokinase [Candidatus Acidoferrales bacterium]
MDNQKLIYLSLGSNLGDRAANLERAIEALRGLGVHMVRRSAIYETEPVDFLTQPWFLNCVVEAETILEPLPLLQALQGIERNMGSQKLIPRGPRIIDLDILFYEDAVIREQGIEIPHPRLADRRFVLVPMAELAPQFMHPVLKLTIRRLLETTQDQSAIRVWQSKEESPGT